MTALFGQPIVYLYENALLADQNVHQTKEIASPFRGNTDG